MSEIDLTSPEVKAAIEAAVSEAVQGLKDKNTELLGKLKKAQKDSAIDPADLEAVERERDDLRTKLTAAEKLAKKATTDLEAATKRASEIDSAYSNSLRDAALTEALTKAGVTDAAYLKAAKVLLASGVQVVDADGKRVVKAGEVDLEKHITDWAGSDEGKRFVTAADTQGGGSHGGRAANPETKGNAAGTRPEAVARAEQLLKQFEE